MESRIYRAVNWIWLIFLNGLLTLLPFTLTLAFFTFIYRILNSWLMPIYELEPSVVRAIPGSAFILVVGAIFIMGVLVKFFFVTPLIHFIEGLFFKIPLMRQVYSGIKQLVHAFNFQDEMSFQKVVMVPFPHEKSYAIGFLTSELPAWVHENSGETLYNVFVPTTPNPTSGFLVQVPQSQIKITSLSRQEAMSLIISGGIIKPMRVAE